MFSLIDLPYGMTALEPVISARTLEFHHGKHLKGYVDNLNKLIPGTAYEDMHLEDIVLKADGAVFNNAGQILNHNMYFEQFSPVPKPAEGRFSGRLSNSGAPWTHSRLTSLPRVSDSSAPAGSGFPPMLTVLWS